MTLFPDAAYFNAFSIKFEKIWWMASRFRIHISGRDCVLNHEFDFIRPCHFTEAFQRILQQFFGADPLNVEPMLARFDAGQREQVFRKAGHPGRVLADDFQKSPRT